MQRENAKISQNRDTHAVCDERYEKLDKEFNDYISEITGKFQAGNTEINNLKRQIENSEKNNDELGKENEKVRASAAGSESFGGTSTNATQAYRQRQEEISVINAGAPRNCPNCADMQDKINKQNNQELRLMRLLNEEEEEQRVKCQERLDRSLHDLRKSREHEADNKNTGKTWRNNGRTKLRHG